MKKTKLPKPVQKWVKALRSGKYRQTKHQLGRFGAFCCLGVACKLAVAEGIIKDKDFKRGDESLPKPVQDWLGMKSSVGALGSYSLASMNDNGEPFTRIADEIESRWTSLRSTFSK